MEGRRSPDRMRTGHNDASRAQGHSHTEAAVVGDRVNWPLVSIRSPGRQQDITAADALRAIDPHSLVSARSSSLPHPSRPLELHRPHM